MAKVIVTLDVSILDGNYKVEMEESDFKELCSRLDSADRAVSIDDLPFIINWDDIVNQFDIAIDDAWIDKKALVTDRRQDEVDDE